MNEQDMWRAVLENDQAFDGAFFYAVRTTGIFCRPSCASRPPKRENTAFFPSASAAGQAGFRPCKRCRPDLACYAPLDEAAARARGAIGRHFADSEALERGLGEVGLSSRRLAALFHRRYGMTPTAYRDSLRIELAKSLLADGSAPVADIAFAVGFGSLSAFYRAFRTGTGLSPAAYRRQITLKPEGGST